MAWLLGATLALTFWVIPEAWRDAHQGEPFIGGCFVVTSAILAVCFAALFGALGWWMLAR